MKDFVINKIGIKLFLTVILSLSMGIVVALLFSRYSSYAYILKYKGDINVNLFNFLNLMTFIIGMLVFTGVFYFFIRKKIKYIQYLSKNVDQIAKGNLGYTMKVHGKDEIGQLCKSINIMSLKLKEKLDRERENEKMKNDLITNISHDLRTPLTTIIGYLELIQNHKIDEKESIKSYIQSAYDHSLKMKKLVGELFEYTKLCDADFVLNIQKIDIGLLIHQIVGEYIPIFEKNHLKIEEKIENTDFAATIDIDQFIRVLDNLLSNALKYSYKNTTVLVQAYRHKDCIKIIIHNKGDHLSKKKLNKMFDKFYKVDVSRKDGHMGSGIGLSIAKKIVELHGGKIWAECEENHIRMNILVKHANEDKNEFS